MKYKQSLTPPALQQPYENSRVLHIFVSQLQVPTRQLPLCLTATCTALLTCNSLLLLGKPLTRLTALGLSIPVQVQCESSFSITIQPVASQLLDRCPQLWHTAPNDTPGALQPPSDLHLLTSNPCSASFLPHSSQPTPASLPNQHSKAVEASSTA